MAPLPRQQWRAHPRLCWREQRGRQWGSGSCYSPPKLFFWWQQHCQCSHGSPWWLPPAPHSCDTVAPAHNCCFCTSSSPCQMHGSRKQIGSCGFARTSRTWLDRRCNNRKDETPSVSFTWNIAMKTCVTEICKLWPSNCTPSMATSNLNRILNLDHSIGPK